MEIMLEAAQKNERRTSLWPSNFTPEHIFRELHMFLEGTHRRVYYGSIRDRKRKLKSNREHWLLVPNVKE